jgi:hypothetical protein
VEAEDVVREVKPNGYERNWYTRRKPHSILRAVLTRCVIKRDNDLLVYRGSRSYAPALEVRV